MALLPELSPRRVRALRSFAGCLRAHPHAFLYRLRRRPLGSFHRGPCGLNNGLRGVPDFPRRRVEHRLDGDGGSLRGPDRTLDDLAADLHQVRRGEIDRVPGDLPPARGTEDRVVREDGVTAGAVHGVHDDTAADSRKWFRPYSRAMEISRTKWTRRGPYHFTAWKDVRWTEYPCCSALSSIPAKTGGRNSSRFISSRVVASRIGVRP